MKNKYYTPTIEEFHVGFEYEVKVFGEKDEWVKCIHNTITDSIFCKDTIARVWVNDSVRVKYLDREDIESLGFTDKLVSANSKFSYYKILENDKVCQITEFWSMCRSKRENLIRVYIGSLYKYPYTEIFRGNIKNKSELKRLMQQLNINERAADTSKEN